MRGSARAASALLLIGTAIGCAGCGSSSAGNPAELALRREDLIFVARTLEALEPQSNREVAATRLAWPLIYAGLPARSSGLYGPKIRAASESAERLGLPALFSERNAASLTGPASTVARLYRAFNELARKGWEMIAASIAQIEQGTPEAGRFARANVALYIDGIYDAHFGLGQIGNKLLPAYAKLGGQKVFGSELTQAAVSALAATYSEANDRLRPHETVKLGS